MDSLNAGLMMAFWFGLLTAVSPCPLTTNIAAMTYIGRQVGSAGLVLVSGIFYTAGRVIAYTCLGYIVVFGLISVPGLSIFLQNYGNQFLGVLLIIAGMFLLELLTSDLSISAGGEKTKQLMSKGNILWSVVLGFIFALSFCPPSAALFFGSVIPLSIRFDSVYLVPLAYGMGTGLPVLVFALVIAKSAQLMAKTFERIQKFEWWARRVTGVVFIIVGIYLTLIYIYKIV